MGMLTELMKGISVTTAVRLSGYSPDKTKNSHMSKMIVLVKLFIRFTSSGSLSVLLDSRAVVDYIFNMAAFRYEQRNITE